MNCLTPRKRAYEHVQDADMAARISNKQAGSRFNLRVYKCDCGCYHLTSSPLKPQPSQRYF